MDKLQLASLKEQYERDGYAVFPDVLDQDLMQEAKQHIEWLIKKYPDVRPENMGHMYVKDDPFWLHFMSDDRLLDIAEQFIGPDIALFASHYISKRPYDGRPVLWHQDGSYWPLEPMEVASLWIAVDDSTPENGCLRVIPGTHKLELQEMKKNTKNDNLLNSEIDPAFVDESKAVDVILKSGSVSMHHPNIIHGSEPNLSPKRRCGISTQYIATGTKITVDDVWPCAFLLRGKDEHRVNRYMPRPKYVEGECMPFRGSEHWV